MVKPQIDIDLYSVFMHVLPSMVLANYLEHLGIQRPAQGHFDMWSGGAQNHKPCD